ncbi:MAG: hypothetical protein Q9160_005125 [Pyrenula sp. 1 TL-2023]
MALSLVAYTAVLVFVFTLVFQIYKSLQSERIPAGTKRLPGPKGLPFIGNLHQIPATHSWLKFYEWSCIYGPIYQISIAGRTHVIVSSEKIANDLLRERGSIYSSREQLPMAAGLLSDNLRPVLLPYGDVWRRGRKVAQSFTGTSVAARYEGVQEREALYCVMDLLEQPAEYERWFERFAASVILTLTYGKKVETGEEEVVRRIMQVNHHLERIASPGSYLVDTFPSLNWLPSWLAPWKREGKRLHKEELDLFMSLLYEAKPSPSDVATKAHSNPPSKVQQPPPFARTWWLTHNPSSPQTLTDPQAAYVLGTLFEAGAGTSKAALCSFLLALLHHPTWQHQLHAELDTVIPLSSSRLPTFTDLPSLPLLRACVKETLRWRPVTSGGLPHASTSPHPDTYAGYAIPACATVHPNQWAIHRDESLYPDPEAFNPRRWLDPSFPTTYREPLTQYPNLQNFSCFGFGRRICVGQNIAERNLMIVAARVMWAAEIKEGEGGLPPLYEYRSGFNSFPQRFGVRVVGRGEERIGIVKREYERMKREDRAGAEGMKGEGV